jgi:hypothetical protein
LREFTQIDICILVIRHGLRVAYYVLHRARPLQKGTEKTGMHAHQSKLLSIKDVIRDLQPGSDAIVVLSAISQNVLYEKETKLVVEEAISLRGAA